MNTAMTTQFDEGSVSGSNAPHIKIKLYWNKYKGTGKAWLAKIVNGKYVFLEMKRFKPLNETNRQVYEGIKEYEIREDGKYVAHEQNTKTRDLRHIFEVKNGKILNGKTTYGSGYDKGEEINFKLEYDN